MRLKNAPVSRLFYQTCHIGYPAGACRLRHGSRCRNRASECNAWRNWLVKKEDVTAWLRQCHAAGRAGADPLAAPRGCLRTRRPATGVAGKECARLLPGHFQGGSRPGCGFASKIP
jgi:hypothetical protein